MDFRRSGMKTIKIHPSLHEVFGKETTAAELLMIFTVSAGTTLVLFISTRPEWSALPIWKSALCFLLIFDIMAGFIANLTSSTNNFYRDQAKSRLVFIALHIQPVIFSFLLGEYLLICFAVWVYTIISALAVNGLQKYPAQKPLAGSLAAIGLVALMLSSAGLPILLLVSLAFYQLKVIYSFAVDQYSSGEV